MSWTPSQQLYTAVPARAVAPRHLLRRNCPWHQLRTNLAPPDGGRRLDLTFKLGQGQPGDLERERVVGMADFQLRACPDQIDALTVDEAIAAVAIGVD